MWTTALLVVNRTYTKSVEYFIILCARLSETFTFPLYIIVQGSETINTFA